MYYAQLKLDGSYDFQITTNGNVEWDATHFCPASTLTPEEAVQFHVVPLSETQPPTIDPIRQSVARDGGEFVNDAWQYKWTVTNLSAEQIAANLDRQKAALWITIKNIRDLKVQTGGYTTGGKWYHSDTFSRTQQMALVMMGISIPAVQWKTMDGSFVTMTQILAGQIFAAAAAQDQAMFLQAETLRAQVNAASDPATVDITAGWPATFN